MNEQLYSLLNECTVRIDITRIRRRRRVFEDPMCGTGFFVAPGQVLTAANILEGARYVPVQWHDWEGEAEVVERQSGRDFAVLRLKSELQHPCVYPRDSIRPGDMLYSFAYLLDDTLPGPSLSSLFPGEACRFECEGVRTQPALIKFKAGIVELGGSGAPLLNERSGAVCGMVIRGRENAPGGYAIPIKSILEACPALRDSAAAYHDQNPQWLRIAQDDFSERPEIVRLGAIVLPSSYRKLIESIEAFFADRNLACDDYHRNVFVMTRFQKGNKTLVAMDKAVRDGLRKWKLNGHRADDRCYPTDRNLWDNVCTYMFACKFGIAVLEDILQDEFNPNVALEYGFMRALGKPVLLLKEKRLKPRADILGTLWEEFDILDIESTVTEAVDRWVKDCSAAVVKS